MIRTLYYRWRFNRITRKFDKQIGLARKAHAPVRHIQKAKQDFVHGCLRSSQSQPISTPKSAVGQVVRSGGRV